MKRQYVLGSTLSALGLVLALLWLLGGLGSAASAAVVASRERVEFAHAPAAELHVCPSGCTYSTVQAAVDAATAGDVIKVATGVYTDVSTRQGVTQTVYVSKTVTVRGGYTTTNWTVSDPDANPTTLDAQGPVSYTHLTLPTN